MNRKVADFLAGRTNFLMLYDENGKPAIIKERDDFKDKNLQLHQEFILDDKDKKYKALWNKFHRNYFGEYKEPDAKPKSMGGKKPYVMVMSNEIKELKEQLKKKGVKNYNEIIGCLVDFSNYMEWGTGKLIDKRQRLKKKQLPLKYKDLLEISGYSRTKLDNMLRIMKENKLLWNSDGDKTNEGSKGYFISQIYFKKGRKGS